MKHRFCFLFILCILSFSTEAFSQPGVLGLYTYDINTGYPTYIRDHLGQPLAVGSIVQVIVDSLNDGIDPPQANGMPGGDDWFFSSFPIGAGLEPMEPGVFATLLRTCPAPWQIPGCLYEGWHFYLRVFETTMTPIPAGTYYQEILHNGQLFVVPHGDTDLWNIASDIMRVKTGMQIINPTANTRFVIGTTFPIRWLGGEFTGGVSIALNRNYPAGTWETLFDNAANDSVENWLVTQPAAPLTTRLRVRAVNDSAIYALSELVNITNIGFQEPLEDNTLFVGDTTTICWSSTPGLTSNVRIALNRDFPTGNWEELFPNAPNDSAESWVVTGSCTHGKMARLRIIAVSDTAISDVYRNSFAIVPKLDLLQPNGGEHLVGNTIYPIRWRCDGRRPDDSVLVEVNYNYLSGAWEPIGVATDSLEWLVAAVNTNEARIRISYLPEEIRSIQDSSDSNFSIVMSRVEETIQPLPVEFSLATAYPNPFNATTSFKVAVPRNADVRIALYNTMGQKVTDLHHGSLKAGYHLVTFNASQLSSGSYIVRMDAPGFTNSQMIQLVK